MQISDLFTQLNQQTTASGNTAPGAPVTETYAEGSSTLSALKEGEMFEGTVMNVENGKVTISLANGSSILARLDTGVSLTQGAAAFFQVKSNQGGQIALKAVAQDNYANPTLVRALTQAGVSVSGRNLELVKAMMNQQLPIDTKSVLNMVRSANAFPTANVSTLAQLQKLSLPVNELNIEQFSQYNSGEGQIGRNLEAVMKALPDLIQQTPGQSEGIDVAKQILSLFVDSGEAISGSAQQVQPGQTTETVDQMSAGQSMEAADQSVTGQNKEAAGQIMTDQTGGTADQIAADQAGGTADRMLAGLSPQIAGQEGSIEEQGFREPVGAAERTQPGAGTEGAGGVQPDTEAAANSQPETSANSGQPVADAGTVSLSTSVSDAMQTGEETKIFGELQEVLEWLNEGTVSKEEVSELFGKRQFQELLQNAVRKQWFISPQEVADKQKLEKLYERIDRQMSRLQEIFANAGQKDSPPVRQMADTRSNISFLNQLNHLYNYVQIPLRMANQNATGDLYVYTNRKNLAQNRKELSAHLHLEMEHLGTTDVFVKLNAKKLSTNFIMEDERSLDLVMEHLDILTQRLSQKGYEVDIQVKENPDKEQQMMFMQELLGQQTQQPEVSRYSFDVKV